MELQELPRPCNSCAHAKKKNKKECYCEKRGFEIPHVLIVGEAPILCDFYEKS